MKQISQRLFKHQSDKIILAGISLLFAYFLFFHEVREMGDTFQYMNQFVSREPVYALLLYALTGIFGENGYPFVLALIQNVLAVISVYWLYHRLMKLFDFHILLRIATAIVLLAPHIVTPLASQSHMIITNSILTEGISISIYYLWFGILLTLLLNRYEKRKALYWGLSFFLAFFLSLIRGQLMICILVMLIVASFCAIVRKKAWYIPVILLIVAVSFIGKTQLTKIYNKTFSDLYVDTVSSKPMMLANIMYVAKKEDAEAISDPKLKETFLTILSGMEKEKLTVEYAPKGLINQSLFHEKGHEDINFNYIIPGLNEYISNKYQITESEYMKLLVLQDQTAAEMIKEVIKPAFPEFLKNYFVIASLGFVRSIAVEKSFLPAVAVILYVLFAAMTVLLLKKNMKSPAAWFALLVVLLICGTVFGTSIMIECISRYMIYNLPMFYIAGMALVTEFVKNRNEHKNRNEQEQEK